MRHSRPVCIIAAAMAIAGCHDSTSPSLSPQLAAGNYLLVNVTGRGPSNGTFVLTNTGSAERRVRYTSPPSIADNEYVAVGTFELQDGKIEFALREDGGKSQYVWHVGGNRSATSFSIVYPDPADGPNIVETYARP